jgi:hypothetical protein
MADENPNRFDSEKWNALLRYDADISEAAAKLRRFGDRYVDDFAASYMAIGEKRYLPVILAKLLQAAERDAKASEANSRSVEGDNAASPSWKPRRYSDADTRHSASKFVDNRKAVPAPVVGRYSRRFEMISWGAAVLLILVALGGGAQYLEEKSKFDAAHGDTDRLAKYVAECWLCASKSSATDELQRLQTEAAASQERSRQEERAQEERTKEANRIEQQSKDADESAYSAARGDIFKLRTYVETCTICNFKASARAEIDGIQRRLDEVDAAAREANERIRAQNEAARSANHVTMRMVNNTGLPLVVAFYSETRRGTAWPAWNRNLSMPALSNDYNLTCQPGEKICFGAWRNDYNPAGQYWGVGIEYRHGCNGCCAFCDGGVHVMSLAAGSGTGVE